MTEEKKPENEPVVPGRSDNWPGFLEEIRIKKYLSQGGAMVNTIFQQIREEGIEIGEQRGEQRGEKIGEQRGEKIGEQRGAEKSKIRMALNCLMKGMDVRTIAELTELPAERIESLKTTLSQENTTHP